MKKKLKTIKIENCTQCPHYHRGSYYSMDGWYRGYDGMCRLMGNKIVAVFIERPSQEPKSIPDSCPLP